jgi:hypothetical protein
MPRPKEHDHDRESRRESERKNVGDDPKRHELILARRWLGSPPPTFDRYANALKQWSKLPGAVVQPPGAPENEGES